MKISCFTTMTNPEQRGDPWREALNCYKYFFDDIVTIGEDWPEEFKFDLIGKYFQKGYDQANSDWVFRMDIDYFFHEKDLNSLEKILYKYNEYPAIFFPQYQFFTPDRYQIKTRLAVALNKKKFSDIKFDGGGDLCLPTLKNKILHFSDLPNASIPIYQYDSLFRTKDIIANDRARFARAWYRQFGNYGDRGGETPKAAYEAWIKMIEKKYKFHTNKINLSQHPTFIKKKLENLEIDQFGYDAFGLANNIKRPFKNYIKGYKERFFDLRFTNLNY